jgi:hypothetical protein
MKALKKIQKNKVSKPKKFTNYQSFRYYITLEDIQHGHGSREIDMTSMGDAMKGIKRTFRY